jgi:hypothetical protein
MMPLEHLSRQAYLYYPTGRRDIGRPRRRWAQKSFSRRTGRDSMLKLTEEEEKNVSIIGKVLF